MAIDPRRTIQFGRTETANVTPHLDRRSSSASLKGSQARADFCRGPRHFRLRNDRRHAGHHPARTVRPLPPHPGAEWNHCLLSGAWTHHCVSGCSPLLDNEGDKTGLILGLAFIVVALFTLPRSGGFRSIAFLLFQLGVSGALLSPEPTHWSTQSRLTIARRHPTCSISSSDWADSLRFSSPPCQLIGGWELRRPIASPTSEQAEMDVVIALPHTACDGGSARYVRIDLAHRVYNRIGALLWDHVGAIGDDKPLTLLG